ncbi:cytochrome d ubiquinol oxidase subunit II [Aureibacter tunicatorum]|uniref:Cytochrome d ubiquinol oxidase subunit II n=1 Tax=Aureibacter tunicatorum TaxID=866807 RepID=A0AAE3XN96_9BACT|nr:cytochrome d ubiquinol oxidase subunit II [Aureibacter tunicatorum]MDR6238189.1 cytochrome d ubiquinol oxidase subunit II [Aureibacter tunicatorum]BDD03222.1 cytochrome D oxidase subunit I [Aureibacter tunicatorum]
MDYNVIWYVIVGILLIGFAILDGFDLGVGILHLFTKTDHDRRIMLNSIGPVWDGNEVWLITAGGALFAAFPEIYATAFSGFYLAFMLLLIALIFRAVSIEFRSKEKNPRWRKTWDFCFFFGSVTASILFGVAIGNAVIGLHIESDMEYHGTFLNLLNPYALLCGFFNMVMFALHGAVFLNIKTEGKLQRQVKSWIKTIYPIFVILFIAVTGITLSIKPEMIANFSYGHFEYKEPSHQLIADYQSVISSVAWLVVFLNVLSVLNIPRAIHKNKEMFAFISSSCTIAALISLFALGIFPNLLISNVEPEYSLNIYNGSSSQKTLKTMFEIAIWGMPFVLAYTSIIYWTYRGKTVLNEHSY